MSCVFVLLSGCSCFFFFNAPATTEIYTLSLHDALPISEIGAERRTHRAGALLLDVEAERVGAPFGEGRLGDRKSTRLNSSHLGISYAVFCLKKKKKRKKEPTKYTQITATTREK